MPAIVVAAVITAGVTAGSTYYASRSQRRAAERAKREQDTALDRELEYRRQKDAEDREERRRIEEAQRKQWEAEQEMILRDREEARREREYDRFQWDHEQARMSPYRDAGYGALSELANRAGLPTPARPPLPTPPDMSMSDWTPPGAALPDGVKTLMPDPASNGTMGAPSAPPSTGAQDAPPTDVPLSNVDRTRLTAYGDTQLAPTNEVTPEQYASIASSPEAIAQMSPGELDEFTRQASRIPLSAVLEYTRSRHSGNAGRAV